MIIPPLQPTDSLPKRSLRTSSLPSETRANGRGVPPAPAGVRVSRTRGVRLATLRVRRHLTQLLKESPHPDLRALLTSKLPPSGESTATAGR